MKKISLVILVIFLIFSCDKEENRGTVRLTGLVQKGPFIEGTEVKIQSLLGDLSPSGSVYFVETQDDFGSFSVANIGAGFSEINTSGYYYNEITGQLSSSIITLKAIVNATSDQVVNVNLLTTLSIDRIKYLIREEGKTFEEAQTIAQTDVLNFFHIDLNEPIVSFYEIDLSGQDATSSILLAISCVMQVDNTEAQLSELVTKISRDLEVDGIVDNLSILEEIRINGMAFTHDLVLQIIGSLQQRYSDLGLNTSIPDFSAYLDSNGDGIIDNNQVSSPYFNIPSGAFDSDISVEIYSLTPDASIHYTLDNTEPTVSSALYTSPISISGDGQNVVVKAIAIKEGLANSIVTSETYSISYPQGPYPSIDKLSGVYKTDISVTFVQPANAQIYYSTDGTEPTLNSSVYTTPINISGDGTFSILKAFTAGPGLKPGKTITSVYKIDYSSNTTEYMQGLTLADYKTMMVGNWIGSFRQFYTTPAYIYRNTELSISESGEVDVKSTYSSWTENHDYLPAGYMTVIYDQINLTTLLGNGKANGEVILSGTSKSGEIIDVQFSNNGDYMTFYFVYDHWAYHHYLVRVPE